MSKRIGHDETAEDARPQAESYWNDDRDADNAGTPINREAASRSFAESVGDRAAVDL